MFLGCAEVELQIFSQTMGILNLNGLADQCEDDGTECGKEGGDT